MKAPHLMTPEERKDVVLRSLDEAREMARMNEGFSERYQSFIPEAAAKYRANAAKWRAEESRLKSLRILATSLALLVCSFASAAPKPSPTETVAAVLVAEAGGEGVAAMKAVREVVQMRAWQRQQTEADIVTARLQFSCLNRTTPARLVARSKAHPAWPAALALASRPVERATVWQANHYHALTVLPKWAKGQRPVAVVGGHAFYRL